MNDKYLKTVLETLSTSVDNLSSQFRYVISLTDEIKKLINEINDEKEKAITFYQTIYSALNTAEIKGVVITMGIDRELEASTILKEVKHEALLQH